MEEERDDPVDWGPRATDRLDWSLGAQRMREPVYTPPTVPPSAPIEAAPAAARTPWLMLGGIALACALIGGVVGGAVVAVTKDDSAPAAASPIPTATQAAIAAAGAPLGSGIADVVAKVRPAVVKIESSRHVQGGGVERDVGSGVLIDTAGHVVTNAHVVLGTETLNVVLSDGSSRPAILLGHDSPFTDIAVLQIGLAGVTPVPIGESKDLRPGDTVIAIGNPLDQFEGSVTTGVVSGVNRARVFDEVRQDDLIQTDAALNNGNSGGALLNLKGEFIGMPTAILRESPGAEPVEGVGFAIPSDRVMAIANGIIAAGGAYPRPDLGIEDVDLAPGATVRACRLSVDSGALVTAVTPGGPGALAGLQVCDVITKIGTDAVDADNPLLNALVTHKADETVTVVLNRGGRIIETDVRLGKRG